MSESSYSELAVLFSAGVGLLVLGGVLLLLSRRTWLVRGGAVVAVAVASAAGPAALGHQSSVIGPILLVAGVALVIALAGSARLCAVVQGIVGMGRRPAARAAALAVLGAAVAAGAVVRLDLQEQALTDQDTAWMMGITSQPLLRPAAGAAASTDGGRPVYLAEPDEVRAFDERMAADRRLVAEMGFAERVIRLTPASDDCNCHGWVFTGGRFWVSQNDVEHILVDNGYQPVSQPRAGDLVIYRVNGQISHTAVVRAGGDGQPVLVEGKWGWMGLFVHPVDACTYGTHVTFFRSGRAGHLLIGVGGSAPDFWDATDE